MISCYVVEDEKPAREQLIDRIENHEHLYLLGSCSSARQAMTEIEELKPKLLFLDIELPDMSGLDILKILTINPFVIFTTAYDRYAVEAFNYEAVDFLLKPYLHSRFNQAVEKVKQKGAVRPNIQEELQNILSNWKPRTEFLKRIPSRVGDKIYVLNISEIVYFASKDKVVIANRHRDSFIINFTLDELQNRLNPEHYIRIHRSTIVNLEYLQTIEPLIGGAYMITVNDSSKTRLQVSRNAGKAIKARFNW